MEKERRKKRTIIRIVISILLVTILILSSDLWLSIPGTFLCVKDNIQKADCIVPLRGDLYSRFEKTVELFNRGLSEKIVVSVLPGRRKDSREHTSVVLRVYGIEEATPAEFTLITFRYFGKSPQDIFITDRNVTSTFEEAVVTKEFMIKKGFKSLILVTSHYHMRRALMIFKLVFRGSGIKIYNCTAGRELIDTHHWWHREYEVKTVIQEYLSVFHNFIYHFLLKKGRTSFDSF